MIDNAPIAYGKDELTFSINLQENKAQDWMADWSGRVVVEGKTYFLNGYIKKEGWVAGKLKPEQGNINISVSASNQDISNLMIVNNHIDHVGTLNRVNGGSTGSSMNYWYIYYLFY